jgi:hypothetical protein
LSIVLLGTAAPSQAATRSVVASVAATGSVSLRTLDGAAVRSLRAGRYAVVVHDRSRRCGFRLVATVGILVASGGHFVGSISRAVELRRGSYWYSCGNGPRHLLRVSG